MELLFYDNELSYSSLSHCYNMSTCFKGLVLITSETRQITVPVYCLQLSYYVRSQVRNTSGRFHGSFGKPKTPVVDGVVIVGKVYFIFISYKNDFLTSKVYIEV